MTGWFLNHRGDLLTPDPANNSFSRDPGQSSGAETQFRCCEDDVLIVNGYHGDHQAGFAIQ